MKKLLLKMLILGWFKRRIRKPVGKLMKDQRGATTLEWTLILAAFVLPGYAILRLCASVLIQQYQLFVTLNGLPLP